MKEIIKVLLQEGIDEETIHEVLDIIQEVKVETVDRAGKELFDRMIDAEISGTKKEAQKARRRYDKFAKTEDKWRRAKGLDEAAISEVKIETADKVGDARYQQVQDAKDLVDKLSTRDFSDKLVRKAEKRTEKLEDKYQKHLKLYNKWREGIVTR